jgi:hypothetical protein
MWGHSYTHTHTHTHIYRQRAKLTRLHLLLLSEDSMLGTTTNIGNKWTEMHGASMLTEDSVLRKLNPICVICSIQILIQLSYPRQNLPISFFPRGYTFKIFSASSYPMRAECLDSDFFLFKPKYNKVINYDASQYVILTSSPKYRQRN